MTHTSPASYLVWSTITSLLATFLVFHLWSFDRFKCLKWNHGPYNGAFKRIMTYSYIITIPMILVYALGNTIIKYREGFISHAVLGIIPKPYQFWEQSARNTIFPLMLFFSIGWSLEMVTHLEELCFWLFLVNSGSAQQDWFRSLYFRTWMVGSVIAVIYMPLVTIFTRSDPLRAEAYTFLAGSLGSLSLTLWFTPILWTFPSFLNNLRREGVDTNTIVRLTKFSELNSIRVVFRFLMTVPLLILGVDGVRSNHHINESMVWTDVLVTLSGFGTAISSALTLVIFFPRSIEGEIAARDMSKERKRTRSHGLTTSMLELDTSANRNTSQFSNYDRPPLDSASGTYLITSSPVKQTFSLQSFDAEEDQRFQTPDMNYGDQKHWVDEERDVPAALPPIRAALPPVRPNRRRGRDVEMGGIEGLTEANLSDHNLRFSNVNPMVNNFTSPIDFAYATAGAGNESRLTFSRR